MWGQQLRSHLCSLRITPQAFSARICLCTTLHAYTCSSIRMLACPSVSLHCSNNYYRYWNINQLSISYALCLGLGPDLPWDDDRCPGTLRLSVEGILTLLFATHTGILSSCLSTCPSGQASPMQERSPTQLTIVNCQSFGSVL